MQIYQLPCTSCSQCLPVAKTQAGETLQCKCGANVVVPTLRELSKLETLDTQPTKAGSHWSQARGIVFAIGLLCLALGIGGYVRIIKDRGQLNTSRPEIPEISAAQIEKVGLREAWETWLDYRDRRLEFRATPEFLKNEKKYNELTFYSNILASLGAAGLVTMLSAVAWPASRKQSR
ncbi:MAG: hypothetical protein R3C28_08235 [Pirellulaceae bacterium]